MRISCVAIEREQMVDDGEIAVRLAFPVGSQSLVDGGQVEEHADKAAGPRFSDESQDIADGGF